MRQIFFSYIIASVLLLSFFTNWYFPLVISLQLLLVCMVTFKIGRGIVLMETTATLYVFTCLTMPLIGYKYYSLNNSLSRLWKNNMPIPEDIYFQYALPAITIFCLAITFPSLKNKYPDSGEQIKKRILAIREVLQKGSNKGLQIIIVGVIISMLSKFLPAAINYFAVLIFFASFAGILYVYFYPSFRYKRLVIVLFCLFIMSNALQTGMFTIVIYMGITIFSFFQVGNKISVIKKISIVLVGIAFAIVLQNVKGVYRLKTWRGPYEGNKVELFSSLFVDNLQKGSDLIGQSAFFPLYTRTNQGFNVAVVMNRIPRIKNFDYGERLLTVLASAFVPRFLWSDKPEAGGKFNMKYYAGVNIVGWSTNVGTLGEAYGSFGVTGGIIYMFVLGLFLRWVYFKVFILSAKIPLLICWLPVLFFETTSSSETETLQIINSIIKAAFFIWLLTKYVPQWFGIDNRKTVKGYR